MIEIQPFRALHYDRDRVRLADVIAPPYDVIDDAYLGRLYDRSPHNVVRLILNRDADRYAGASATLAEWRRDGVLTRDDEPSLFHYVQDFRLPDGREMQRSGLLTAVRLQPFSTGNIRPHERTFARAKEDRLRLLRACGVNFSPIFGMYSGHESAMQRAREASGGEPWVDVRDDRDERHRVWRISDAAAIEAIAAALQTATVLIADGHHRYETALAYRDERIAAGHDDPDAPHQFMLFYLAAMSDPGLVILPTHRVLERSALSPREIRRRLEGEMEIEEIDAAPLLAQLEDRASGTCFGLCLRDHPRPLLLRPRDGQAVERRLAELDPEVRRLDVTVLDAFVLRHLLDIDPTAAAQEGALRYTHDDRETLTSPESGAVASFLLRAPTTADVESVCLSGHTMPEKSTYFYPKLLTGLVFRPLE